MNNEAFWLGAASILKTADWLEDTKTKLLNYPYVQENIVKPMFAGAVDEHFNGLMDYNLDSHKPMINVGNAMQFIIGGKPAPTSGNYDNVVARLSNWLGRSPTAKQYAIDQLGGAKGINELLSKNPALGKLVTWEDNGVRPDAMALPRYIMQGAADWMKKNPDTVKNVGLGIGALGAGGLALNAINRSSNHAAPQDAQPTPFAKSPKQYKTFDQYIPS